MRSIGETVKGCGQTSGIIPFVRVMDSLTLAISQGSLRRGSAAVYLDVHHPEIEEFIEIRKPSGDFNRKSLNLHHGVCITDEFMHAVRDDLPFALRSPKDGEVLRTISARHLWQKILETRLQTGEPYLLFSDTANNQLAPHQRELGPQGAAVEPVQRDPAAHGRRSPRPRAHRGVLPVVGELRDLGAMERRSAFHRRRAAHAGQRAAGVHRPRAGVHGHARSIRRCANARWASAPWVFTPGCRTTAFPFESALARAANLRMFKHLRREADAASRALAEERGACPDAAERGVHGTLQPQAGDRAHRQHLGDLRRHQRLHRAHSREHLHAQDAVGLVQRAQSGADQSCSERRGLNTEDTWQSILAHEGSVQHLERLSDDEKSVFRTAFEIDQRWVVELAADRAPLICQGQSLNLYLRSDIHKWDLLMLHWTAWERGVKSLYYCRSKSVQRAGFAGVEADNTRSWPKKPLDADNRRRQIRRVPVMSVKPQIELIATPGLLTPSRSYKPFRYPWAIEYWRRQQQIHWMPEEIPLGEDCKDWNNRITDAERNLLTQVFRFFTQSDVEVQDNYMERYARVFRPTEIKMMLAAFANMETVHIAAYALLLETLGMPDSEFTAFMDYAAMRDKHDYLQGFGVDDRRRRAAHAGHVRRLHRRPAAVRELRHPVELPAPQQDARHGAGGLLERARRDAALRRHHPAVPHLRAGDRRADAGGARTTSSNARAPW